jgi:hypothetical protein
VSKQGGLGDGFLIDQYRISPDISSVKLSGGPAPWECTGLDKSAYERIGLIRDGDMEAVAFFNPDPNNLVGAHLALSSLPLTDRTLTYQRGTALGSPAASLIAKQGNYDPERADDGSLTIKIKAEANGYGLVWGYQATPGVRHDTTATNGASVDDTAGSTFGLTAFLHVTGVVGTSVTVKLQESSDNGGADAFADVVGGAFTAVTPAGLGAQRIQTSLTQTVERYLRVVTTGTFTSADFCVVVFRHPVAVTY